MTVVQIERQKIDFLLPINIPIPEYRIGQLVEAYALADWSNPNVYAWFPGRVTGMAYATDNRPEPVWEYQVKFLNSSSDVDKWFIDSELWLLEDC
ncbi:hypothetical protein [Planktothrix pseudagardhii]|uniref:Uncharacterized protein n=1 Tax=Planktothrix pseudagardhii TaxID=132604 RepID=A0A9W4CWH5_9CYAN|nr:hypothetical protein [Planktothrix pseudagardhii]CAD5977074.1 hypothetical protein NO713_04262 [Planktothrix pseudagardhii]